MLEILYQDEYIVIINKPSGLLVHRSMIDRHETEFALQMVRDQIGRFVYPVHRLDKPTSGVLVFALSKNTARLMTEIFIDKQVQKEYLAVVRGHTDKYGIIDYPLKEQFDKMTDAKADKNKEAQSAVTEYTKLATVELPYPVSRYPTARYSLLKLIPKTGRKHQIRRHMKHILHPIVGDTTHGRTEHNRLFREKFNCHRLLLSAVRLSFTHPLNKQPLSITAPLDDTFGQIIDKLGWTDIVENDYCSSDKILPISF
ncbi:MAG: tRNA pseudouridine(65) synthase TruC [Helicobacteraceae bacterium 4484_230]|nr:MAG: tRNA pseudouridine(65) synthase TruC [Helicobacteraceae bacterium 4484_230]